MTRILRLVTCATVMAFLSVAPMGPAHADGSPQCNEATPAIDAIPVTMVENYEMAAAGTQVSVPERFSRHLISEFVLILNGAVFDFWGGEQAFTDSMMPAAPNPKLDVAQSIGPRDEGTFGELIQFDRICTKVDGETVEFNAVWDWTLHFTDGSTFQYHEEGMMRFQRIEGSWMGVYQNTTGTFDEL